MSWIQMNSHYENSCIECDDRIFVDDSIFWNNDGSHKVKHVSHGEGESDDIVLEEATDSNLSTLEKKKKEADEARNKLSGGIEFGKTGTLDKTWFGTGFHGRRWDR